MARDKSHKSATGDDATSEQNLDRALLDEHAGDADPERLATLYGEAAALQESGGDIDAACFFYTHAFVHALEAGDKKLVARFRSALLRYGREEPERG